VLGASDVPLWAAILIGLGGGGLAVFARIAYERGVEFRTRQIAAADEYIVTLGRTMKACRDLWVPLSVGDSLDPDNADRRLTELRAARDEKFIAPNRCFLLFNGLPRSREALVAVEEAAESAAGALEVLYGRADIETPIPGMKPAHGLFTSAAERQGPALLELMVAVRLDVQQTWLRRKVGNAWRLLRSSDPPPEKKWAITPKSRTLDS
jgi:hypothetical protein